MCCVLANQQQQDSSAAPHPEPARDDGGEGHHDAKGDGDGVAVRARVPAGDTRRLGLLAALAAAAGSLLKQAAPHPVHSNMAPCLMGDNAANAIAVIFKDANLQKHSMGLLDRCRCQCKGGGSHAAREVHSRSNCTAIVQAQARARHTL